MTTMMRSHSTTSGWKPLTEFPLPWEVRRLSPASNHSTERGASWGYGWANGGCTSETHIQRPNVGRMNSAGAWARAQDLGTGFATREPDGTWRNMDEFSSPVLGRCHLDTGESKPQPKPHSPLRQLGLIPPSFQASPGVASAMVRVNPCLWRRGVRLPNLGSNGSGTVKGTMSQDNFATPENSKTQNAMGTQWASPHL